MSHLRLNPRFAGQFKKKKKIIIRRDISYYNFTIYHRNKNNGNFYLSIKIL